MGKSMNVFKDADNTMSMFDAIMDQSLSTMEPAAPPATKFLAVNLRDRAVPSAVHCQAGKDFRRADKSSELSLGVSLQKKTFAQSQAWAAMDSRGWLPASKLR